jgi:nickel-dependent lactate racemase
MAAGIPLSRKVCQVKVSEPYDFIITSPGGYPKDINLYQSQKALGHAALVMRTGGTVILVAACPEGAGSQCYETWVKLRHTHQQVIYDFNREGFRIGPHKAYQIARDSAKVYVLFYTAMAQDLVSDLLMNPVDSLQAGINEVLPGLSARSRIGVMPNAASTIPYVG